MKPIYKILLFLILIITITIYFYTNRFETHAFRRNQQGGTKIVIINKWSGETLVCCGAELGDWFNLGTPKDTSKPTPTN